MAKKEFTYRGKRWEELQAMSIKEFAELLPARMRRSLLRGLNHTQKKLLADIKKGKTTLETHSRDMIIMPEMVGTMIKVHKGNNFEILRVEKDMIGHMLGEFAITRRSVKHSSPGIGATRSSASMSVR